MSVNIYNKAKDSLTRVDGGGSGAIAMTMAEWIALNPKPQDGTQIVITDDVVSGGGKDTYSTEETLTNKVWIDGKPIYRRVITGLSMSFSATSTEWQKLSTSLDIDVEFLVTADVYRYSYKVPTIIISSIKPITYHNPGISWSDCNKLVLEYTKTTD